MPEGSNSPTSVGEQESLGVSAASTRQGPDSLESAKGRAARNLVANWISYAINFLVILLITPVVVHRLGNVTYGVWGIIGQLIEYSFLLDFGVRIAATRYVAGYLALDQPRQINAVITTGLVLNCVSGVLALACGAVFAWVLPRLLPIPPGLTSDARLSVLVLAVGIAASFPGSLFNGCVAADSRYDLLAVRKVAPTVLRALLLWFFLERGYGLLTVALVSTLTVVVGYFLDFLFTLRLFPHLCVSREFFDKAMLRTLVNFSFYAFVISVASRLIFMTDNIVVGFFLGPAAVTFYAVGLNVASMLRETLGNLTSIYTPLAYQMSALERKASLRRLFISGSRIGFAYVLPGVLGLAIVGPRFLGYWMGSSFIVKSGPVLILLAIEVGFYALTGALGQVLYGMNRHNINAWLMLCNALVNFALSVILVHWLGAVGVAWGTVIPAFLVEAVILPVYTAGLLHVSPIQFYHSAVLRPLLVSVPYGLWLWFCVERGLVRGYPSLALVVASGLVLYGALAWRFSLESEERALAQRWLNGLKASPARTNPVWSGAEPL
jgi:O-antigen/teichoic acid export membrane protein